MPFNIGPGELILVLIIALIVVGPGKLPDVGAAIGKSLREFRRAASDVSDAASAQPPASPPAPAATSAAPPPAPVAPAPAPAPTAPTTPEAAPAGGTPAQSGTGSGNPS
jgi:sec-independent protein translocase protein TatA